MSARADCFPGLWNERGGGKKRGWGIAGGSIWDILVYCHEELWDEKG